MTYAEAVRFLYSLGNEVPTGKFDLDRITALLAELGNPQRSLRFVHVAGTNGKGSTCAMIEAGLRAAGVRTGLYTSPHLIEPTERIQLNANPVSQPDFAIAFERVHSAAEAMLARHALDLHPTYFETVTAMAFLLFLEAGVEMVVLEVGLGGRLDATNVVHPDLCVITPIDYDHQFFLGNTLTSIAGEKAGILKPGVAAVFAHQTPEAAAVLRAYTQGPYTFTDQIPIANLSLDAHGSTFDWRGDRIHCPLAGEHQVENARTAALALATLGFPTTGIAGTNWPGRLEYFGSRPTVLLDGAHNPAGIRALVRYIHQFLSGRRIWLVFGAMRDKALSEITQTLFPLVHQLVLTRPNNSRALAPADFHQPKAVLTDSVAEALDLVATVPPGDLVLITGSLFVVGEARALLLK